MELSEKINREYLSSEIFWGKKNHSGICDRIEISKMDLEGYRNRSPDKDLRSNVTVRDVMSSVMLSFEGFEIQVERVLDKILQLTVPLVIWVSYVCTSYHIFLNRLISSNMLDLGCFPESEMDLYMRRVVIYGRNETIL